MHFIAFFCTKTSAKLPKHNFFLVSKPRWKQRQPPHCVDCELFPTLWRPPTPWQKSTISNPESRSVDGTEFEQQTCQFFPKSWTKTTRTDKHKNCCKPVWEIENRNGNSDNRNRQQTERQQKCQHTKKTGRPAQNPEELNGQN